MRTLFGWRRRRQLTLDGGDRLHALPEEAEAGRSRSPSAATCLFALRSAPRGARRASWSTRSCAPTPASPGASGTEIALAEWEDAGSLLDVPLERADYVVFDLETTGTRAGSARIVEIGAVRIRRSRRSRASSGWSTRACRSRP